MVFLSHDCLAKLDLLGAFKAKSFCFRISELVNFTLFFSFTFANVTARHCKTTGAESERDYTLVFWTRS